MGAFEQQPSRQRSYNLTPAGRQRFKSEEKTWTAYATAVGKLLATARPQAESA